MKINKKPLLVFGLLLAGLAFLFVNPHSAFAATTYDKKDLAKCVTSLKLVDVAHMECSDASGGTISFLDSIPEDDTANYVPEGSNNLCEPDLSQVKDFHPGFSSKIMNFYGVNVDLPKNSVDQTIAIYNLSGEQTASINLGLSSGSSCNPYLLSSPGTTYDPIEKINASQSDWVLQWDPKDSSAKTKNIKQLDGVSDKSILSGYNFVREADTGLDPGNGSYLYVGSNVSAAAGSCTGNVLVQSGAEIKEYELTSSKNADSLSTYPELKNAFGNTDCNVKSTNLGLLTADNSGPIAHIYVTGTPPTTPAAAGKGQISGSSNTVGSGSGDSCDLNAGGFTLAWALCPVLAAGDGLATVLMDTFESQLPFSVVANNGPNPTTCKAASGRTIQNCGQIISGSGLDEVHNTWSIIRKIATALTVIVMLVMIISQAIESGPFEAYTVRKMLPKLAAAVILIQLSWPIAAWVVNLVNDIGNGLATIMYLPFGGAQAMDFGSLLQNANIDHSQAFFANILVALAGVLAIAALPTISAACVGAVIALLVGLAVLVFRKILIIMLLITAPLAIIAWVFPGQGMQKYWKLWQDNFIKVLIMYPLIVAIIAAGRIFAHVVGSQDNLVTHMTFLSFIFMMIGYFAPLFIIFKAYKWGGSIMSQAGGLASNFQRTASNAAKEPVKHAVAERFTDKYAQNLNPYRTIGDKTFKRVLGVKRGAAAGRKLGRAVESVKGGRLMPTEHAYSKMIKRGEERSSKIAEQNNAALIKNIRWLNENGIPEHMAEEFNEHVMTEDAKAYLAAQGGGAAPHEIIKKMNPGNIGAAKWGALAMYHEAHANGDADMEKVIADYIIKSNSTLELLSPDYLVREEIPKAEQVLPDNFDEIQKKDPKEAAKYLDPRTGKPWTYRYVPFIQSRRAQDRMAKDNDIYRLSGQMDPNFPTHNHSLSGIERAVYSKGLKYRYNEETKTWSNNPEFSPEIAQIFGIDPESRKLKTEIDPDSGEEHEVVDIQPLKQRYWMADKFKKVYQDMIQAASKGGSTGGKVINEIIKYSEGNNPLDREETPFLASEATKQYVLAARDVQQRNSDQHLKVPLTDLAMQGTMNSLFNASGKKYFTDKLGRVWKLNITNLKRAGEDADSILDKWEAIHGKTTPKPSEPAAAYSVLNDAELADYQRKNPKAGPYSTTDVNDLSPATTIPPGGGRPRAGAGRRRPYAEDEPSAPGTIPDYASGSGGSGRSGFEDFEPSIDGLPDLPGNAPAGTAQTVRTPLEQEIATLETNLRTVTRSSQNERLDPATRARAAENVTKYSDQLNELRTQLATEGSVLSVSGGGGAAAEVDIDLHPSPPPVGKVDVEEHYRPSSNFGEGTIERNAIPAEYNPEYGVFVPTGARDVPSKNAPPKNIRRPAPTPVASAPAGSVPPSIPEYATAAPVLASAPLGPQTQLDSVDSSLTAAYQRLNTAATRAARTRANREVEQLRGLQAQLIRQGVPGSNATPFRQSLGASLSNSQELDIPVSVNLPQPDSATVQALYTGVTTPGTVRANISQLAGNPRQSQLSSGQATSNDSTRLPSNASLTPDYTTGNTSDTNDPTTPDPQLYSDVDQINSSLQGRLRTYKDMKQAYSSATQEVIDKANEFASQGDHTSAELFRNQVLPRILLEGQAAIRSVANQNPSISTTGFSELAAKEIQAGAKPIPGPSRSNGSGSGEPPTYSNSGAGAKEEPSQSANNDTAHYNSPENPQGQLAPDSSKGDEKPNNTYITTNITKEVSGGSKRSTPAEEKGTSKKESSDGGMGQIKFDRLTKTMRENTEAQRKVANELRELKKKGMVKEGPSKSTPDDSKIDIGKLPGQLSSEH